MAGVKAIMLHHIRALFNTKEVVLALILLQLLSSIQGVINYVPNVTVSTLDGVSFSDIIKDIKPHPSDPNSLLLIDQHALLSLNILTKQTSTVVGVASSSGYVEGVGGSARFYSPSSFIFTTEKEIIVSDTWNHCLREVDLSSRQTSRLAGTCQSGGYKNGAAQQAQFLYQVGLLQYKTGLLIADTNNDAIRELSGGFVSTIAQGTSVQYSHYFTQIEDTVYIGTAQRVLKLDPETESVQPIAGDANSTGDSDGPLMSATFNTPFSLMSLSPDFIVLSGVNSNRLRIVDLLNQMVTSICTGTAGSVDGASDQCRLRQPWSIAVLNEMIYVGELQKIRTIPLNSIVKKGQISTDKNNIVYIAIGVGAVVLIVIVLVVTIIARRTACKNNNDSTHQTHPISSDSEQPNLADTRIDEEMKSEAEDDLYATISDISEPLQGAHGAAPGDYLTPRCGSIHDYVEIIDGGNQTSYVNVNPDTNTGETACENN